jgi:hypothetical protein
MKVEWKMSPYFGVLPLVFRALREYSVKSLRSDISTPLVKVVLPALPLPVCRASGWARLFTPIHANPQLPEAQGRHSMSLTWKLGPFVGP